MAVWELSNSLAINLIYNRNVMNFAEKANHGGITQNTIKSSTAEASNQEGGGAIRHLECNKEWYYAKVTRFLIAHRSNCVQLLISV